jgi:protein-tyrosine phosphatase
VGDNPVELRAAAASGATLPLHPAQALRLAHFAAEASVDVHCHCLGGLDDGPATAEEALALCEALVADGFTHVIATPHQLGRYDGQNRPEQIAIAAGQLRALLFERRVPLTIEVAADVRIDERIVSMVRGGEVSTVCGAGRYLLLELPHEVLLNPARVINDLRREGVTTILTHPERHPDLQRAPEAVAGWLERGAILQVTAGSVVGDFGDRARDAAWRMLERGWVALVATDAHDAVRRPPRMTAAAQAISARFSHAVARRLCVENPLRVLRGEPVVGFAARAGARAAAGAVAGLRPRRVRTGGVA